ncbi:MAG: hypothetical protein V1852_24980 [Pseudomonadota bacterium]
MNLLPGLLSIDYRDSSQYYPIVIQVRIKPKNESVRNNRGNYFVFNEALYFNEANIDDNIMTMLCECIKFKDDNKNDLYNNGTFQKEYPEQPCETSIKASTNIEDMTGIEFEQLIKNLLN